MRQYGIRLADGTEMWGTSQYKRDKTFEYHLRDGVNALKMERDMPDLDDQAIAPVPIQAWRDLAVLNRAKAALAMEPTDPERRRLLTEVRRREVGGLWLDAWDREAYADVLSALRA